MRAIHKYNVSGLVHAYNAQLLLGLLFLYNTLRFLRCHLLHRSEKFFLKTFELLERQTIEFVPLHPLQTLPHLIAFFLQCTILRVEEVLKVRRRGERERSAYLLSQRSVLPFHQEYTLTKGPNLL